LFYELFLRKRPALTMLSPGGPWARVGP